MNNHDLSILGLLTANISIDAIAQAVKFLLPVMNVLAVALQIGIGVFTLLYVYRKWRLYSANLDKKLVSVQESPGQAKKE